MLMELGAKCYDDFNCTVPRDRHISKRDDYEIKHTRMRPSAR